MLRRRVDVSVRDAVSCSFLLGPGVFLGSFFVRCGGCIFFVKGKVKGKGNGLGGVSVVLKSMFRHHGVGDANPPRRGRHLGANLRTHDATIGRSKGSSVVLHTPHSGRVAAPST